MANSLRWVWLFTLLTVFGVGFTALHNWVLGKHVPLWMGPVTVLAFLVTFEMLRWCERRGWIKGVFYNYPKELEDRKRSLATERERIIAEAATKMKPRSGGCP